MFAEVAVNVPVLHSTFHYHIPEGIEVQVGHLVQVSFRTGLQHGIVVSLSQTSPIPETKPILGVLYPEPLLTPRQIDLALWLSKAYRASLASCLWLLLPPGITGGRDTLITLLQEDAVGDDPVQQQIITLLRRRGALRMGQIGSSVMMKDTPSEAWRGAIERLAKRDIISKQPTLTAPRIKPKMIQTAALTIHPDQIGEIAHTLGKASRRADILEALAVMPPLPLKMAEVLLGTTRATLRKMADEALLTLEQDTVSSRIPLEDLNALLIDLRDAHRHIHILRMLARESDPIDVSWVYAQTGATLADLKRLEEEGYVLLGEKQKWRDPLAGRTFVPTAPPTLTQAQAAAWEAIKPAFSSPSPHPFLLHGVTGSGKTEIYLRAIDAALKQGRGALFLVPEIALTPQTVRRVAARFPGQVAVMHSGLNDGERYDMWRRVKEGLARVVVGARSALFAPMDNIGTIILDEAHDTSYKQSPHEDAPPFVSAPHYDARITAEEIAKAHNAVLIFGSATPSAEMIYRAELGEIVRLHLPDRILGHREGISEQAQRARVSAAIKYKAGEHEDMHIELPPVTVVDMREELRAGNTGMFSRQLHQALDETLRRGEQAILFLNRRGQSTYVFCRDCGYVAACPNCDTPLTYHRAGEALRCHHCGHSTPSPLVCPQCGSQRIKFFGAGTQQVEQALLSAFPQARPVRWDADTASNALMHEIILQRFIDHQADVIIGTQMVAKGLDLPMVTLVGVVSADMGLALPEFRAAERTFQLLTQVAGRAGRGLLGGRVILQTYQPGNPAILAAAKHDIDGFYQQEIANRRVFGYPPFRRLVRVVFRDEREVTARIAAEDAARIIRHELAKLEMNDTELIGPAPCFMTKLNKHYRWHLLLRGPDPARVLDSLALDPSWYVDIDPVELL